MARNSGGNAAASAAAVAAATAGIYQGRSKYLFSREQHMVLEDQFAANPYPSRDERASLAAMMGVKDVQIQNWFQNRRARGRQQAAAAAAVGLDVQH